MATRSQFDLKIGIRLVAVPLATATVTATHLKIQLCSKDILDLTKIIIFCIILLATPIPSRYKIGYLNSLKSPQDFVKLS